jgi:hypothetical protein
LDRGYHPWHSFKLKRNLQAFDKHCTDLVIEERANLAVHARSLSVLSVDCFTESLHAHSRNRVTLPPSASTSEAFCQ